MPKYHRRCIYLSETGLQCETWFPVDEDDTRLCPSHREIVSPARAAADEDVKVKYIDLVNEQRAICAKMTFEELDMHIAGLEKLLEDQKTKLYSARATKTEKLDALSEEERKELRKIKLEKLVKEEKPKKATIKSDPVRYMMQQHNISEGKARALLGLD